MRLSKDEFERLVSLFPEGDGLLPRRARAALMANNVPSVALRWLEEEGLLDPPPRRGLMRFER